MAQAREPRDDGGGFVSEEPDSPEGRRFAAMLAKARDPDASPKDLIDLYLSDLEGRASPAHFANVKCQLSNLLKRLQSFDPIRVLRYRTWRKSKGRSNRTINAEVTALSTFYEWAKATRLVTENPIDGIKCLPERACDLVKNRRAMTDAEIVRFLAASRRRDIECDREHPITPLFQTLIETGLRFGRCSSLLVDDLGKCAIYLRPQGGKSGPPRAIPIRPRLAAQLRKGAIGPLLFVTPYTLSPWEGNRCTALRIFYDTLKAARIDRIDKAGRSLDLHALRWTAVTRLHRKGVDGTMIQKVVGHSSRAMTDHYTHFSDGDVIRAWKLKVWK